MNITGLDTLVFGVDDIEACHTFLVDYGLEPVDTNKFGGRYESLDGSAFVIREKNDPTLPQALPTGTSLRKTIYGVKANADLDSIEAELKTDREVKRLSDGSLEVLDDMGFCLGFQVSIKREVAENGEMSNVPGAMFCRPVNHAGVDSNRPIKPRTLSHVVYFVPDGAKAEAFYVERLGFRCTDRLLNAGPFLQVPGSLDHHALFLIQTPPFMQGIDHCTFHFAGPHEVITRGKQLVEKGYQSFWGPGRHVMGSNWFWYFNSPLNCKVELDADMDLLNKQWIPREAPMSADASQTYLLTVVEKWVPGGKPPQ
jgi:catechol 2,3-dioxygenase-like lactoylglutathione lyase family enzyme